MCGRYARRGDKQKIAETFHVKDVPDFAMAEADYNVAPTTFQPVIRQSKESGERERLLMRWGLIPFFQGTERRQGAVHHQREGGDDCDGTHLEGAFQETTLSRARDGVLRVG